MIKMVFIIAVSMIFIFAANVFAFEQLSFCRDFSSGWKFSNAGTKQDIRADKGMLGVKRGHNEKAPVACCTIPFNRNVPFLFTVEARSAKRNSEAYLYLVNRGKENIWQTSEDDTFSVTDKWQKLTLKFHSLDSTESVEMALSAKKGTVVYRNPELAVCDVLLDEFSGKARQEFWINMDYYDEVVYCKNLGYDTYEEKEIVNFFTQCRENRVDGVLWRVSMHGQMDYHSQVATVFPGATPIKKLSKEKRLLAEILTRIDPLEIAVREAKKNGIKIFIWMTLSDEKGIDQCDPHYCESDLLIKHPEYSPVDKNGEPMRGTLCYYLPEVRKYRLDIIRELLNYKADGIYLCTRTHANYYNSDPDYKYGYNLPIVKEYKKRYGKDIRTEEFDKDKWLELRAEGMDLFIEEAGKLVRNAGQELMMGLKQIHKQERGWPYGKARNHSWTWIKNGWVDHVLVGHNLVAPFSIVRDRKLFAGMASAQQKIYFWGQMVNYGEHRCFTVEEITPKITASAFAGSNGIMFHEAVNFEELKNRDVYFPEFSKLFSELNTAVEK